MPTLQFKGKSFVKNHHLNVKYHQLIPEKDKSLTDTVSLHDNLIIQGDNLIALKALLPTYAGKVKCIYIDPPYNTGVGSGQWVYNDNVNSPMIREWLGKVVNSDDLTRHDKWLCMMMPRLTLLKEMLTDDGVIFISINDVELYNLKLLMDEIFEEKNHVGTFIWRKKTGGGQTDDHFVTEHEYILVYRKSEKFIWKDEVVARDKKGFNKKDARGYFSITKLAKWGNAARKEDRESMHFPIVAPDGTKVIPYAPDGSLGRWRVGQDRMKELIDQDLIYWSKNQEGKWVAYEKKYYSEDLIKVIKERSILYDLAHTDDAANILTDIFGKKDVFENPKPYQLIQFLLRHTTDKDSIILDAFAGSGTTAHSVLAMNEEDKGNRRFILIESEEYAYDITAKRVKGVVNGVPNSKDELLKKGIKSTFSFFTLGEPIEMESLLRGDKLPSYEDLARYVFYTATGEEFDETKIDESRSFIGESKDYEIYLFYKPDIEYLKATALTLERAEALGPARNKTRLVFAPMKYLDAEYMHQMKIEFAQLPFEIYRFKD